MTKLSEEIVLQQTNGVEVYRLIAELVNEEIKSYSIHKVICYPNGYHDSLSIGKQLYDYKRAVIKFNKFIDSLEWDK